MVCSYSPWETRRGSRTQYVARLQLHIAAKWRLLSFSQRSSWCCPTFCWLFLAADVHQADDLRQLSTVPSGSLSWAVTASSRISIKELWFGLFSSTHITPYVYPHWSSYANIVPFVQFREILQDFLAIGMAFDCPKEVRSIHRPGDFVRISFCRLWMMLNKNSLRKHPLLPPLHHESPSFASHPFTSSQSKNEPFLHIL